MPHVQQTTPETVALDVETALAALRRRPAPSARSPSASASAARSRSCRPPRATPAWRASSASTARSSARASAGRSTARRRPRSRCSACSPATTRTSRPTRSPAFDAALPVEHEIHVYDGAPHSFFDRRQEQYAKASPTTRGSASWASSTPSVTERPPHRPRATRSASWRPTASSGRLLRRARIDADPQRGVRPLRGAPARARRARSRRPRSTTGAVDRTRAHRARTSTAPSRPGRHAARRRAHRDGAARTRPARWRPPRSTPGADELRGPLRRATRTRHATRGPTLLAERRPHRAPLAERDGRARPAARSAACCLGPRRAATDVRREFSSEAQAMSGAGGSGLPSDRR